MHTKIQSITFQSLYTSDDLLTGLLRRQSKINAVLRFMKEQNDRVSMYNVTIMTRAL